MTRGAAPRWAGRPGLALRHRRHRRSPFRL